LSCSFGLRGYVVDRDRFSLSVPVTAGSLVPGAVLRFIALFAIRTSFALASTMAAMTSVATVTEQVHRDKGNERQNPEPVFCEPCHVVSPLELSQ
jgi:hypothetical protein